jgi:hypothetical protein
MLAPSAYYMKSPPQQFRDSVALEACNAFIDGRKFALPTAWAAPIAAADSRYEGWPIGARDILNRVDKAFGLPGLFIWHWIEGHYLLRRGAPGLDDRNVPKGVNTTSSAGDGRWLTGVGKGVFEVTGGG